MGGKAFKEYDTPRLTLEDYAALQAWAEARLRVCFDQVATPIPDPDKRTHGDVDFIVSTPDVGHDAISIEQVGAALEAVAHLPGTPTTNYLVRRRDGFAQVDVHRCQRNWYKLRLFLNSYSRLGHILCAMVLRFGLFLDMRGLWTSKPTPSQPAFVITSDLATILSVLHLDAAAYTAGFSRRRQIWEWIEDGQVAGTPLIRGWRGATTKAGDEAMEEWNARRAGEPKVTINKEVVLQAILRDLDKVEEYDRWQTNVEAEQERQRKERERQMRVKVEVTRRLQSCTAKGKEIKEEARRIRAEVEAEYSSDVPVLAVMQ